MWDLTFWAHIWCVSGFVLKTECYITSPFSYWIWTPLRPWTNFLFFSRKVVSLKKIINVWDWFQSAPSKQQTKIQQKGLFSSLFSPKNFGFWFIILQNGSKHQCKIFDKKVVILYFGFWSHEAKKHQKEPQEALMRAVTIFLMKLNMTLKILVFCISSLQSSWYFVF